MIALALSVIFSVTFGHVLKWSERRKANPLWVGALNYAGASLVCAAVTAFAHPAGPLLFTIVTGGWGGVCYLVSLLYYFAAVDRLGVGRATSAIRISVSVPVALSLLLWHERVQAAQAVGLALVLLALPLLGRGRARASTGGAVLTSLLAPLVVITGLGQLAARVFSSGAPAANSFLYLTCLFAGAAAAALVVLRLRPVPLRRRDLGYGLLLGSVNVASNACLLAALRALPAAVAFAVSSSGGVVLAALTGMLVWGERLSRPAAIGVALAAVAVVLLTR